MNKNNQWILQDEISDLPCAYGTWKKKKHKKVAEKIFCILGR